MPCHLVNRGARAFRSAWHSSCLASKSNWVIGLPGIHVHLVPCGDLSSRFIRSLCYSSNTINLGPSSNWGSTFNLVLVGPGHPVQPCPLGCSGSRFHLAHLGARAPRSNLFHGLPQYAVHLGPLGLAWKSSSPGSWWILRIPIRIGDSALPMSHWHCLANLRIWTNLAMGTWCHLFLEHHWINSLEPQPTR